MLAHPVGSLPDESGLPGGVAYEPKFDGYRALLFVQSGWCRIQSRHGRDITSSFPDIAAAAVENLPSGVVIDGDLVVWGDDADDFRALQFRLQNGADYASTAHPASFIAFDVLAGAGMDMRRSPLRVRRQALTILLDDAPAPLHVVPQTRDVDEARTWLVNYAEAHVGVTGVVAKGLGTPYSPDESGWVKQRIRNSIECIVGAVSGSLRDPEQLILGRPDATGVLRLLGCTAEMTLPQRRRMSSLLSESCSDHPWQSPIDLHDVPGWRGRAGQATLVNPTIVVEVDESPAGSLPWATPSELIRSRPELLPTEIEPDIAQA
jgi:ATP-dependent DNA ligase